MSNGRRAIIEPAAIRGALDRVVEIVSPWSRRTDEATKRRLDHRFGVQEYWIVDPEVEVVKVHRRQADGSFPRVAELMREAGHTLDSPLLQGFTLRLESLFG